MDNIRTFVEHFKARHQENRGIWNAEDGCVLKGLTDLYKAVGNAGDRQWVLDYLDRRISTDGTIARLDSSLGAFSSGKALFFALDETGEERYRKAADLLHAKLAALPAADENISPERVCYMVQPFRTEYDRRFLSGLEAADIARNFRDMRAELYDADKRLYRENSNTPACFRLRPIGWHLMALVDCIDAMSEQLYEHRRSLMDLFLEAVQGLLPYADPETGLFYQAVDRADTAGYGPETSGSAMIAYAVLKGVRLGLLDPERYSAPALKAFRSLVTYRLALDNDHEWRLDGICPTDCTGPNDQGGTACGLHAKKSPDDAMGVGAFMMAWAEYLQASQ